MDTKPYYAYWGKSGSENEACHLLPYHSLDVAAVAKRWLERDEDLRAFFATALGVDGETASTWIVYLLVTHDLGKFASSFQDLRGDVVARLGRSSGSFQYRGGANKAGHDSLGFRFWASQLLPVFQVRYAWPSRARALFAPLFAATTCHHGFPPVSGRSVSPDFTVDDIAAAKCFSADAEVLCGAAGWGGIDTLVRAPAGVAMARRFSWWLAGFAVFCDWLGSNRVWFDYRQEVLPLPDYWRQYALPGADRALAESGALPVPGGPALTFAELLAKADATPLQAEAMRIPLGNGPALFLLEDVTGAGKTEAAFILIHRMMTAQRARGFYFALPTMATANAMYRRSKELYRKLFAPEAGAPSLILAHGKAQLDRRFTDTIVPLDAAREADYLGEPAASAHCAAWLADNRKKSLLAHAGIGTIDQALLAILQSRHQSLRQFGLLGKVLVVDEVHANDTYMHRLLRELLAAHAAAGGSAILLSATLPMDRRRQLVEAFNTHAHYPLAPASSVEYPLLTAVTDEGLFEAAVSTRESVKRTLGFQTLSGMQQALDWVVEQARDGACVCWVRNTVGDAIDAWESLAERLPPGTLDLFHARFTLGDRLEIETRVLDRFGEHGNPAERAGRVLIATQVIEQSLDVDFDAMISDLAPVDLLIQRAGRMRRHQRDADGALSPGGMDARPAIPMAVLGPPAVDDADQGWIAGLLPGTGAVYPDHAVLWRSQHLVETRAALEVPEQLRAWIEAVYGAQCLDVPEGIEAVEAKMTGKHHSHDDLGIGNAINLDRGYQEGGPGWWAESRTPTRLGEPSVTLRLLCWDGVELSAFRPREPWAMSEVSVRESLLGEAAIPGDEAAATQLAELQAQWRHAYVLPVVLVPAEDGGWVGEAADANGKVVVRYDRSKGLAVEG